MDSSKAHRGLARLWRLAGGGQRCLGCDRRPAHGADGSHRRTIARDMETPGAQQRSGRIVGVGLARSLDHRRGSSQPSGFAASALVPTFVSPESGGMAGNLTQADVASGSRDEVRHAADRLFSAARFVSGTKYDTGTGLPPWHDDRRGPNVPVTHAGLVVPRGRTCRRLRRHRDALVRCPFPSESRAHRDASLGRSGWKLAGCKHAVESERSTAGPLAPDRDFRHRWQRRPHLLHGR